MFGTSGIRGPVGDTITADLGLALGRVLAETTDTVVIGRDTRTTGPILADATSAGLRECGTDVIRLGIAPTPTIARSVAWNDADAGIAVTASHNPPTDNGFKLWQSSGQSFTPAMQNEIATKIQDNDYSLTPWDETGSESTSHNAIENHQTAILSTIKPSDISVIVDVGNGTGSITATVLRELGCRVETLNAQPDGRFPGRPSEPTESNCKTLRDLVATTDADLGIAHDGDADRALAVADDGTWIPGDILLAVFASHTATPGDQIAAPINTSLAIDDYLATMDVTINRTPVGDVHVADEVAKPNVVFGGEPSGAWIWPKHSLCPDGPLAAAKLVELVTTNGPLSGLIASIDTYPIHRTSITTESKDTVMDRVRAHLEKHYSDVQVDTRDGYRVDLGDAWFLIRPSGTQPLIRVTAEARQSTRAQTVFETATDLVEAAVTGHD